MSERERERGGVGMKDERARVGLAKINKYRQMPASQIKSVLCSLETATGKCQ